MQVALVFSDTATGNITVDYEIRDDEGIDGPCPASLQTAVTLYTAVKRGLVRELLPLLLPELVRPPLGGSDEAEASGPDQDLVDPLALRALVTAYDEKIRHSTSVA